MADTYKPIILSDFSGGFVDKVDANALKDNQSPDLQNISFDGKGSITPRLGIEAFGVSSATLSAIYSTYTFVDQYNNEVPMRSWGEEMEYYNTATSSWSRLKAAFQPYQDFGFVSYDDFVYFCNAINPMYQWNGKHTKVSDTHASSATTLYLDTGGYKLSGLGWLSAGSFICGTQEAYYASLSGQNISSITGISASIAAGSPITQLPLSSGRHYDAYGVSAGFALSALPPRGNILIEDGRRLYVAGVSSFPGRIFNSHAASFAHTISVTDFSYSTPRTDGEGNIIFLGGGGAINAMQVKDKKIYTFQNNVINTIFYNPLDTTTQDFVYIEPYSRSRNGGAKNNQSVVTLEDDLLYLSPAGGVKRLSFKGGATEIEVFASFGSFGSFVPFATQS